MTCGIYKLTTPSGKVYIGQSVDIEQRWVEHKRESSRASTGKLKNSTRLRAAYKKYSWTKILKEVVEVCRPEQLNEKEIHYVALYNSFTNGLNSTSGGDANFMRSEETREKLRQANLGRLGGVQAQAFYIDGVRYVSVLDASTRLAIPHKTIHNRLNSKNIKYANYIYEDETRIPNRRKTISRAVEIKIDGVTYASAGEASIILSISPVTIWRRVRSSSPKFSNYEFAILPSAP